MSQAEAETIADFLKISPAEFAREYLRKAGSHLSLVEPPDGRCVFYAEKECEIYPVRPMRCRTFPFWRSIIASPETWNACRQKCPGIGRGRLYSLEEIERIVRWTSERYCGPQVYPR